MRRLDLIRTLDLSHQELAVTENGEVFNTLPLSESQGGYEGSVFGDVVGGLAQKADQLLDLVAVLEVHTKPGGSGISP